MIEVNLTIDCCCVPDKVMEFIVNFVTHVWYVSVYYRKKKKLLETCLMFS